LTSTGSVTIPGPTASGAGVDQAQVSLGTRTIKGRLLAIPSTDWVGLTSNRRYDGTAWNQDDATKPSWLLNLDASGDMLAIQRQAPGGANAQPFKVDGTGLVTIPGPTISGAGVDQASIINGTSTTKGRVHRLPGLEWYGFTYNRRYDGAAWNQDDATKPSWTLNLDGTNDNLNVARTAPGGATTAPFQVRGSDGKTVCTLADGSVANVMTAPGITVRQAATSGSPTAGASYTGNSTWQLVCTTGSITVRANARVLLCNLCSLVGVFGVTTATYLGIGIDGGQANIYTQSWNVGTGFVYPTQTIITNALAAGAHNFSVWVWASAGAIAATPSGGAVGSLFAWELA
jgi:hypothetical protein